MTKKRGFGKFLAGLAIGAGLGVLFAPKKGSETRQDLKNAITDLFSKIKDIDVEEVKETMERKLEEIRIELENLDKETVLKTAKEKARQIKDMATNLVNYTIEKGTPVLEKSANLVLEQSIKATKEVLKKLENMEKETKEKSKKENN